MSEIVLRKAISKGRRHNHYPYTYEVQLTYCKGKTYPYIVTLWYYDGASYLNVDHCRIFYTLFFSTLRFKKLMKKYNMLEKIV